MSQKSRDGTDRDCYRQWAYFTSFRVVFPEATFPWLPTHQVTWGIGDKVVSMSVSFCLESVPAIFIHGDKQMESNAVPNPNSKEPTLWIVSAVFMALEPELDPKGENCFFLHNSVFQRQPKEIAIYDSEFFGIDTVLHSGP